VKKLTVTVPLIVLLSLSALAARQSATNSQRTAPVAVGEMAPDFALLDQNGNRVALSDVRGKNPVVLVFFRGYW
jgi:cytochrome oxidase Cu insertion factor (SCO1/SenC/PrrC family)